MDRHLTLLLLAATLAACCPAPDSTADRQPAAQLTAIPSVPAASPTAATGAPAVHPGVDAYRRGDYAAARPLLESEAAAGDAEAQYLLGELHFRGHGTPRNYAQARHWLEQAAAQEHPAAQHRLAEIHAYGYGVPRDTVAANRWEERARANGWGAPTAPPAATDAPTPPGAPPAAQ
ncbi:tetratricopeptide repeat protein [Endothiovibrio diazotrophicus]